MEVVLGTPVLLQVSFGPSYAGLVTVGFTLKNPDATVYQPRSGLGVVDEGGGYYHAEHMFTEPWDGYIEWSVAAGSPITAREDITVVEASPGVIPPTTQYDPDHYLTSTIRALTGYITNAFDPDLVSVIPEFPAPNAWELPVPKVIIHLELDNDDPQPIGFGTFSRITYDDATQTTVTEEATAWYRLNFDVGIWAFQEAGGSTARMETQEVLKQLFIGNQADLDLAAATNGIHLAEPSSSFTGGRHITDTINGQPVWRVMDMSLIVRVAGRRTYTATDATTDFDQAPALVIDGNQPVTTP